MNVPLLDLVAQYRAIKDEVLPAIQEVIEHVRKTVAKKTGVELELEVKVIGV